jgi:hypothetical protein
MFENCKSRLATKDVFRIRLLKFTFISFSLFFCSLLIGVTGYHFLAELSWIDAFLNASMILGGMGPVDIVKNNTAKIFAGCYSLFSGVAFLSSMAIFLTPILHRFLHKFHIDTDSEGNIV